MFIEPAAWGTLHRLAQGYLENFSEINSRPLLGGRTRDAVTAAHPDPAAGLADRGDAAGDDEGAGIAYVYLSGTIAKRMRDNFSSCERWIDLARVDSMLRDLAADDNVEAIVLHLDTPGGYGQGLAGTNALVAEIAAEKPVYTYTDTMQCSAGIWAFCSATEKFVSADAVYGSIGSFQVIFNELGALEKEGVDVTFLRSGKFKAAGHPFKVLEKHELVYLRERLEAHAEEFRQCVEEHTGVAREHMEGQVFSGAEAVEIGLADMVVDSPEELLAMIRAHA